MYILCITDIHGEVDLLYELFGEKEFFTGIDLIIFAGDITHFGGYKQAKIILQPALESGYKILAIPGNCDNEGVAEFLDEAGINLHGRGIVLDDTGFMGVGGSNFTPHSTPTEYSEQQIAAFLDRGFRDIAACKRKVLISHPPPKDTALDQIRPGVHVGSSAVREFLIKNEIIFCLCGHIHESTGRCRVGTAECLNPGAFREGKYKVVEFCGKELKIVRSEQ